MLTLWKKVTGSWPFPQTLKSADLPKYICQVFLFNSTYQARCTFQSSKIPQNNLIAQSIISTFLLWLYRQKKWAFTFDSSLRRVKINDWWRRRHNQMKDWTPIEKPANGCGSVGRARVWEFKSSHQQNLGILNICLLSSTVLKNRK